MSALLDEKRVIYRKTARSALFHLLLSARNKLGINKVLVPSFCCPSVYLAVIFAKCEAIFVDVDLKSYSLLPKDLSKKIDKDTLAVIYPHMFGINAFKYNQDLTKLKVRFKKTIWIEDSCQTYGNKKSSKSELELSLDYSLFSCDPVKPINGNMGFIIQNNNSETFSHIFKNIEEQKKVDVKASRIEELKRLEASYFTSFVSNRRLSEFAITKATINANLRELYFDNTPPEKNIFNFSINQFESSQKIYTNKISKYFKKFQNRIENLKIAELTTYPITKYDMLWRYPIVISNRKIAFDLSYLLRSSKINCSNHYYSLSKIFSKKSQDCSNSDYLSDRILNIWFKSAKEVDTAVYVIKEYFQINRN